MAVLLAISLVTNTMLNKQNNSLRNEVELNASTLSSYDGILGGLNASNSVLRFKVEDLQYSNDTLLQRIDSVSKELKIRPKDIKTAMVSQTELVVEKTEPVIVNDSCEFKAEYKPNELTVIKLELKDDSLKYSLKILNDQYLYISSKRTWKNKRKNFFNRLTHLDFKKVTLYKYDIVNTNDLITVGETRVVENTESK